MIHSSAPVGRASRAQTILLGHELDTAFRVVPVLAVLAEHVACEREPAVIRWRFHRDSAYSLCTSYVAEVPHGGAAPARAESGMVVAPNAFWAPTVYF